MQDIKIMSKNKFQTVIRINFLRTDIKKLYSIPDYYLEKLVNILKQSDDWDAKILEHDWLEI